MKITNFYQGLNNKIAQGVLPAGKRNPVFPFLTKDNRPIEPIKPTLVPDLTDLTNLDEGSYSNVFKNKVDRTLTPETSSFSSLAGIPFPNFTFVSPARKALDEINEELAAQRKPSLLEVQPNFTEITPFNPPPPPPTPAPNFWTVLNQLGTINQMQETLKQVQPLIEFANKNPEMLKALESFNPQLVQTLESFKDPQLVQALDFVKQNPQILQNLPKYQSLFGLLQKQQFTPGEAQQLQTLMKELNLEPVLTNVGRLVPKETLYKDLLSGKNIGNFMKGLFNEYPLATTGVGLLLFLIILSSLVNLFRR